MVGGVAIVQGKIYLSVHFFSNSSKLERSCALSITFFLHNRQQTKIIPKFKKYYAEHGKEAGKKSSPIIIVNCSVKQGMCTYYMVSGGSVCIAIRLLAHELILLFSHWKNETNSTWANKLLKNTQRNSIMWAYWNENWELISTIFGER